MVKVRNITAARPLQIIELISFLAFILINGIMSSVNLSLTYDEPNHLKYGRQILELNSNRFDDSKMPVTALNVLPAFIAKSLSLGTIQDIVENLLVERSVTILVSIFLAWLVFRFAKAFYGFTAGVFALFLYALDPNITAHAQLVTTDLYAAATTSLSIFALWNFCRWRSWTNATLCAAAIGLSQVAKYSGVFLYPLFLLIVLFYDSPYLLKLWKHRDRSRFLHYLRKSILLVLFFTCLSLVIINAAFLFNKSFTPLGEYKFRSNLFQGIQEAFPFLKVFPVPVPYPYLEGLDWVVFRERTGEGYGRIYLLGQLANEGQGFPGYFIVAFLYKVPIAIQLLLGLSLILFIRKFSWRNLRRKELFLLAPILFFLIYFNFFFRAQIGIRFLLIIFPTMHIFISRLARELVQWDIWKKMGFFAICWYLIVSVLSYFPNYLAYFNELVPDRRLAYKILADSNLDWSQSELYLSHYLSDHPDVCLRPESPTAGTVVVPVSELVGVQQDHQRYRWLREHFEPVGTIGYTYVIYRITPSELKEALSH